MSILTGKLEGELEVSASAEKFYEVVCNKPTLLSTVVCPDLIPACDLLDGQWGILGSITQWTYVLGGEAKVAKMILESADSTNNSVTYRVLEGDLMLQFSLFSAKFTITPKEVGSLVSLTLDYIKLGLGVDPPQAMLELAIQVFKLLDAYLINQA
ncbi:hypothetical protein COLO4_13113 [Corchorus olitorius]|uniref:Bet v I/Major latex protein domain-containing protein n=1 Tax=Corchorus olitorius TaxID=93759 RepID=A0A1R3JXZ5_9ROSI|nr:hypothetical protein COLO4_13113 [Corchorus olitorius]